jgi:hypothetical protein
MRTNERAKRVIKMIRWSAAVPICWVLLMLIESEVERDEYRTVGSIGIGIAAALLIVAWVLGRFTKD